MHFLQQFVDLKNLPAASLCLFSCLLTTTSMVPVALLPSNCNTSWLRVRLEGEILRVRCLDCGLRPVVGERGSLSSVTSLPPAPSVRYRARQSVTWPTSVQSPGGGLTRLCRWSSLSCSVRRSSPLALAQVGLDFSQKLPKL